MQANQKALGKNYKNKSERQERQRRDEEFFVQKMKKDGIKLMKETAKKAATARLGGDMKTAKKLDAEIEAIYKAAKDAGVDEDDMVQAEEDGRESAK